MVIKRVVSFVVLVVLLFLFVGETHAQLEVGCAPVAPAFLKYEPVKIFVRIKNFSSHDIQVGGENPDAFLVCEIRDLRGSFVERNKSKIMKPFVIPARGSIETEIDILPYYKLYKCASYLLKIRIDWLTKSFYSERSYFDIIEGVELASILSEYTPDGSFRTFTLETIHRNRKELAFLRIEDENTCYAVLELGEIINLYPPAMLADSEGNVHILFHSRPTEYKKVVASHNGEILERTGYASSRGKPVMNVGDFGDVMVSQEFSED